MSQINVSDIPLNRSSAADRLRVTAAAVKVGFTWWGTRRSLTAGQKEEAASSFGADGAFLSAGKQLVNKKHEKYKVLTAIKGRINDYWYGCTLPYTEPGMRLIRQSDIETFVHRMEEFRDELVEAARELEGSYDELKEQAVRKLGTLFNPSDYPPSIAGLFNVEWEFPSVEPPDYLRQINPALFEQEKQRIQGRFAEAVTMAEEAFTTEFAKLVSHLTERLSGQETGDKKVFHASTVENLTGFFDRFRQLNVGSNAQLDALVNQAKEVVSGITPVKLREDGELRKQIALQLSGVQSRLDGLMVNIPRRRIVRSNNEEVCP